MVISISFRHKSLFSETEFLLLHPKPTAMKLIVILILLTLVSGCTSETKQDQTAVAGISTEEKNKEMIKRAFNDLVAKKNYALIDSFFSPDIFDHGAFEGQQQGREGFTKIVKEFIGSFSQIEIDVEEILADGNMIATREKWKVIRAADNKSLNGVVMHFFRIKDGLITDEWSRGWEWAGY